MRPTDLQTSRKLALCFALIVLTVLGVGAFGAAQLRTMDRLNGEAATAATSKALLDEMLLSIVTQQNAVRGYLISGAPSFVASYRADEAARAEKQARYLAAERDEEQRARMARAAALIAEWRRESLDRQVELGADPANREAVLALVTGRYVGRIRAILDEMRTHAEREAAARALAHDAASARATAGLAVGAAVVAVLALLSAWWLARSIARPLREVAGAMAAIGGGALETQVPHANRRDEVGTVAAALLGFRDSAREAASLREAAVAAAEREEQARRTTERERAEALAAQSRVVEALAQGLGRLAEGDLTWRVNEPLAPEYEALRRDFNRAVEELATVMRGIAAGATSLNAGVGGIIGATQHLSERTESGAASLQETAAALEEITATVQTTARGAGQARDAARLAQESALGSRDVVGRAVEAMGAIERSSGQIAQIIGVIDEIAFQTNLLALNAGVEAARAGDAGRGFTVVATEVRALAGRSAEAAREIKGLIAASREGVTTGVALVGQTGDALARIVREIAEVNDAIASISTATAEQATGMGEVNAAIGQLDGMMQQNAAMVGESSAAVRLLSRDAASLTSLTGRFRLGGELQAEASPPAPQRSVPPQAPPPTTPASRPPRAGPVGGKVVRLPVGAAAESWDAF